MYYRDGLHYKEWKWEWNPRAWETDVDWDRVDAVLRGNHSRGAGRTTVACLEALDIMHCGQQAIWFVAGYGFIDGMVHALNQTLGLLRLEARMLPERGSTRWRLSGGCEEMGSVVFVPLSDHERRRADLTNACIVDDLGECQSLALPEVWTRTMEMLGA